MAIGRSCIIMSNTDPKNLKITILFIVPNALSKYEENMTAIPANIYEMVEKNRNMVSFKAHVLEPQ